MNISDAAGEPSCKRQENGDASTGSERPLKKARFAWQVKGKYHLKKDLNEPKSSAMGHSEPDRSSSSENESDSNDLVGNTEQNLEILGDYLLKQDFNTLDSVITDSEKSLLKPCGSISTDKLHYPKYISSYESSGASASSSMSYPTHSLVSMSLIQNYNEDQCIARWQARQMAKGFVDNTINRVLDSWMVSPLPTDIDNNRILALDVAEFINNLPENNSIENEGILMAISAHGLQNTSGSSSKNSPTEDHLNEYLHCSKEDHPTRSCSSIQSEEDGEENKKENSELNDIQMSWSGDEGDDITHSPFGFYPDNFSSSFQYNAENNDFQNSSVAFERAGEVSSNSSNMITSHFDFMDAAVSFAIQNKGLTSLGTDYG